MKSVGVQSRRNLLGIVCLFGIALPSLGQSVIVPNANAAVDGSTAASRPVGSTAQTIQFLISSTQLTTVSTGSFIYGLKFRLDNIASAWGSGQFDLNFSNYSIFMGETTTIPNAADPTFANNYSSPRVQMRGGALSMPKGFFSYTPGVSPFGQMIGFNMNSGNYQYQGGSIIVEIRHSGNGAADFALDAQANSTDYASYFANGDLATARNGGTAGAIMQLMFSSSPHIIIPEPGTLVLLGLGMLGLVTLRTRKP